MGGYQWQTCEHCSVEGREQTYQPKVAIYARPQGKKGMVRVGWLFRCGHVVVENNIAEGIR